MSPSQLELPIVDPPKSRRPAGAPKFQGYLLHPSKVRQYALDFARRERFHSFTAVSVEFLQRIEAQLRAIIQDEIKRHPSRGKRLV